MRPWQLSNLWGGGASRSSEGRSPTGLLLVVVTVMIMVTPKGEKWFSPAFLTRSRLSWRELSSHAQLQGARYVTGQTISRVFS